MDTPSGEWALKMSTLRQCSLGSRALSESPQKVHGSAMPKAFHQHWGRSADGDWIRLSCSTVTG